MWEKRALFRHVLLNCPSITISARGFLSFGCSFS
jgi:hypothetical protein